jgi:RNA polymerase sigma factor (sigma-70 family)
VNDNDLILDTIQDVFSILWENRKRLSEVQHVRAYLFKTFRNRLLKTSRSNSHFFLFRDIGILTENESSLSPEDIIVQRETKTEISNSISTALEDLTTKQKEILYLRFNCKLSIEEISQTLSIRKQSVSNLLNRAICKLRSNI